MHKPTRILVVPVLAVLFSFCIGVITGCSDTPQESKPKETVHHVPSAAMPDRVKGVHSLQAAGTIDVAFSPEGGIEQMVISEISSAKKSIDVQAYEFTSSAIAKALVDAHSRGVLVRVILDKSQETEKYSAAAFLANAGIATHIDRQFPIAHSKIIIVDNIDVITGSFNFTKAAEHANAENCIILHNNKPLADIYVSNWQWRWESTSDFPK